MLCWNLTSNNKLMARISLPLNRLGVVQGMIRRNRFLLKNLHSNLSYSKVPTCNNKHHNNSNRHCSSSSHLINRDSNTNSNNLNRRDSLYFQGRLQREQWVQLHQRSWMGVRSQWRMEERVREERIQWRGRVHLSIMWVRGAPRGETQTVMVALANSTSLTRMGVIKRMWVNHWVSRIQVTNSLNQMI
jgi:hypothetical protein